MDKIKEHVLGVIRYCMQAQPKKTTGTEFVFNSYSGWALREMLSVVIESKDPPLIALETFRDKMDRYSCKNTAGARYCFSVAKDMCDWVIDLLLS